MNNIKILTESSDFLNSIMRVIDSNFAPLINNKLYLIVMLSLFLFVIVNTIIDILFDD